MSDCVCTATARCAHHAAELMMHDMCTCRHPYGEHRDPQWGTAMCLTTGGCKSACDTFTLDLRLTGSHHSAKGHFWWIQGKAVTRQEFVNYLWWQRPEPIWDELMAERCANCWYLRDDCECCVGCGQINADIIGSHGYHCVL